HQSLGNRIVGLSAPPLFPCFQPLHRRTQARDNLGSWQSDLLAVSSINRYGAGHSFWRPHFFCTKRTDMRRKLADAGAGRTVLPVAGAVRRIVYSGWPELYACGQKRRQSSAIERRGSLAPERAISAKDRCALAGRACARKRTLAVWCRFDGRFWSAAYVPFD